MASKYPNKLRNLGPVSRDWLSEIGVSSWEDLDRIGVVQAYALVKRGHASASLNLLWALEGAHRDVDWRELTETDKQRLQDELQQFTALKLLPALRNRQSRWSFASRFEIPSQFAAY